MEKLGKIDSNKIIEDFINRSSSSKLGDTSTIEPDRQEDIDKFNSYKVATTSPSKPTSRIGDYVRTFGAGVPEVGGTVAELGRRTGILSDETATSIQDNAKMASERLRGKTSPEFQKAASQPILSTDKEGNTQLNPEYSSTTLAHDVVASAPSTIATGLGAGGAMKVGGKILSPILSRLGIDEVVSANFPKLASMAETMFPGAGSSASKVNKMIATGVAAKGGASVSEGLVAAGQNSYQKRQEIEQTPFEKLNGSPAFQEALSKQDQTLPLSERMSAARSQIANMAADDVFHQTFASTGGISLATGGGVIGDVLSKGGGKITGAFIKSMGKGAAEEAIQEFPQSGAEKAISNIADKKYVDPNKDVMEGIADAALKGAAAGAATGGGLGGISHLSPSSKEAVDSGKTTDSVVVGGIEAKITSGAAKNLYNKYNQLHASNPDPNDPGYTKTKDEIIASLDKLVEPKEGKEIDPVLKGEVDAIRASINSGHDLLSKQDQRMKEEEAVKQEATQEAIKPVAPEAPVESISPDSSVVTGEDLVSEPIDTMASESNISPDELKDLMDGQSISAGVAKHSPQDFKDKRYNFAKRQAYSQLLVQRKQNEIDDLSSQLHQANTELRTHPLTLLPNKRAFFEQEPPKAVASIDIDSLKFLNDTLGHEGGDALLKSVTGVLGKYVDAYHISGDEILARGTSKEELVQGLEKAYAELQSGQHTIDTPTHTFSSPSFSYGVSEVKDNLESAIKQADLSMLDAKALREKAGDRAGRGEMPKGFSQKTVGSPSVPSEPTITPTAPIPLPTEPEGVASPAEPVSTVAPKVTPIKHTKKESAAPTFHSSIDKGYEGTANLANLTTAKLPEIISAKFKDLGDVPVHVVRSTKNTVVVRAGYTTSNGTIQLTKEFSIPRGMVNDPGVTVEPESTKELITTAPSSIPLETFEPVDTTPVEASPIDERLNELKAQLDDARITRDFELMKELKQEIEDLGGTVDKVKLDQKKINANLAAEKMEDEESDEAIDNIYGDKESYTNVNGDDVDVEYSLDEKGSTVKYQNHAENKKALDYIFSKMKGSAVGNMISSGDLKIYYVPDFTDPNYNWPNAIRRENAQVSFSPRARGIHIRDNGSNTTYIFLNGAKAKDPGTIVRTFAHEVIGHYGIRSIFGQSKSQLDNYLVRLINSNQAFRDSIFSKKERWISYYNSYVHEYMRLNDIKEFDTAVSSISKLPASEVVMYKGGPVPIDVAIQLADEEMAEIAADLFFSEKFIQNQVGLGDRTARKPKSDIRKGWLNSFLNRVKHLIRKVFGNYTNEISTQDLTQMIAESVDRLFETTPTSHLKAPPAVRREFIYENVIRDTRPTLSIKKGLEVQADMDELTNEDIVHNEYTTEPLIHNINSFVEASKSSDTNLNENVRSKMWGKLIESIKNSKLRGLLVYADMPHSEVYSHIDTVYKGGVGRIEETAKTLIKSLKNINSIQNAQIFEYMTTASANPDIMQITDEQKKAVMDVKEAIKELGRVSAELGIIDKVTYEKNADAYLHTTYLDFVGAYKGSGKRTSTMSYSFKKKNKTERQRAELGQIKDVRFLIPETFGVLARDHVLLEMFSTINEASISSNLHWVLSSKEKIKLPGTKKQATVEDAYKYLDNLRYIYEQRSSGNDMVFGEETRAVPLTLIKNDLDTLEADLKALEQRLVTAAHKASGRTDLTTEDFLRENYVRLPTSKKLGGLSSKFVRKEIANDLEAFTSAYNLDNATTLQKFFARGGTLERMNSFWKTGKIALNPASWFRNIVGNFSLLDLSTSTPSHKLIGMLHEEVSRAIDSKQADGEYWTLAKHYGLFGTTFSAIELQSFFNNYGDELVKARAARERRTDSAWDKHLSHFDEMLGPIFKMAGHKLGGSTAKGFAFVEGAFKAVAFRDYVQTWEKQNGMSYKDLVGEKQNVLLAKAASHANDAIIDYSKAHAIVKDLRRLPFGDPFLTFTYKSLPIMLKSMVNHPIKFAKYATLPALLTTIALAANDWEDKDWERIQKGMTDYHRDNPGMFLYPWKDKTGRMQIADAGYLIPWNQWHVAAKKAYRVYAEDGGESPFAATGKALYNVSNELGFMGGPAPQAVAAFITGKDSFTGQDIARPGTSADQKIMDYMKYAYNMAVPGWLSSSGWFSKLASAYGINSSGKPEVDRFGDIKFTPGQAVSDITGFRAVGVNPETGIQNRMLGFDKQLREISTTRSKMIRDQNLSSIDKQTKLKEFAFREKLIRKQMQEAR